MSKQLLSAIAGASLVLLASCRQRQAPAPPPPVGPPPSLHVQGEERSDFRAGADTRVFNLRGDKVRQLTARLLVYTDGKVRLKSEIVCRWDDLSKPMTGRLAFLAESRDSMGAKFKYLPSLNLSFQSGGPQSQVAAVESESIDIVLHSTCEVMNASIPPWDPGASHVMYSKVFAAPTKGSRDCGTIRSEEDLAAESKGGSTALAVFLNWKP
jgi:hypothetical protein